MTDRDRLSIDTSTTAGAPTASALSAGASHVGSSRPSPISQLTTFPNPFQDEPEPGLLPSLISKVKSTFGGATPQAAPAPPSEAQQIAEAARKSGVGQNNKSASTKPPQNKPPKPTVTVTKPKQSAPPSQPTSASSSTVTSVAPSVSSVPRRHLLPGERWRPAGASPAQVTVSPITSLTTTGPQHPEGLTTTPSTVPSVLPSYSNQPGTPALPQVDVTNAKGNPIHRVRRGSISTIPDSPSSASLNNMMTGSNEYNNFSFVPGFQLPADDTRSVRSFALAKRPGSVSKIIRRMRGEGLSKHYWMADENCKECYDCKSIFTTWRRKHHCRICGQIFCGRCASNIIGARRFGQDGMVRVCNLCLKIMEDYDDDDDRRSISSGISSLPDRVFTPDVGYATSPFAASQLLGRHAANESLSAIDESEVPRYWRDQDRPYTPDGVSDGGSDTEEDGLWTNRPSTAAPFRRMDDETSEEHHQASHRGTPPTEFGDRRDFPASPMHFFPRTETMDSETDPRYFALMESTNGRPGIRSRLSSANSVMGINALLDSDRKDGLWRARSQSFVTPQEFLCGPSQAHFNSMLQQAIETADLSTPEQWHRVLGRLVPRVSTNVRPLIRAGDSIDVRTYIKFKKVPGGKISDSEYVDGIVITKNVAHKRMARRLVNPRIMVVTFPLDYHRVETQFMSLDPIMKQERDYLRRLTRRIIDLRPHIVLAERFVSRIALDYLYEANIVVARGVKRSAIHQVARCTHADVIASMDRLALEPRLGRCAEFKIQTFENDLIPGKRKTYLRFEGTHNGFGGTIILRGGDLATLKKVKVIADFMSLVAYHLKNELFLYGDEFHMLPPHPPMPAQYQELLAMLAEEEVPSKIYGRPVNSISNDDEDSDDPTPRPLPEKDEERADALRLTKAIAESLRPYLVTILSASVAVRFPPPYPLAKMAKLDRQLNHLLLQKDEKEAELILQEELRIPSSRFEVIEDPKDKEESGKGKDADSPKKDTARESESPSKEKVKDQEQDKDKDKPVVEEKAGTKDDVKDPDDKKADSGGQKGDEPNATDDTGPVTTDGDSKADATPKAETSELHKPLSPVAVDSSPDSTVSSTSKRSSQISILPSTAVQPSSVAPSSVPRTNSSSLPSTTTPSQIVPTPSSRGDPYRVLLNPANFVDDTKLAFVQYEHATQLKIWEQYVRKHDAPLVPQNYQGIIYTQALFRVHADKPCTEPERHLINYYQDDDQSLGQFLDNMVNNAPMPCPRKGCEQLMLFHYDVLVHGERRLQIVMEQFMCPVPGQEESILTWSYCRHCNKSWEPQLVREETYRISWGTYLEHLFYPPETKTGFACSHDAYREHIRYFAHRNMVIRIHNDEIDLHEPVCPPTRLLVRVEDKVRIKNQEYESALQRTALFFDSVLFRLRGFQEELVHPDKLSSMKAERELLLGRAVADRDEMVNSLNRTYKQTPPTDVLAINVVLQTLQEKVIQWDLDFMEVEKSYMPTEKDLRRMTANHLKRLFATQDVFGAGDKNIVSTPVPELDEKERSTESGGPETASTAGGSAELASVTDAAASTRPTTPSLEHSTLVTPADSPTAVANEVSSPLDGAATEGEGSTGPADNLTPTPTLSRGSEANMELVTTPLANKMPNSYDSDSTVSAIKRSPLGRSPHRSYLNESSGVDSDSLLPPRYPSRLPRRAHPTPSVSDLVRRFQESIYDTDMLAPDAPPANRALRKIESEVSDSDAALPTRPKIRRNMPSRHREHKSLVSDGDRSYAVNAARIPSTAGRSRTKGPNSRASSPAPSRGRSERSVSKTLSKAPSQDGKPRLQGKGKMQRKPNEAPSPVMRIPRRVIAAGSRVTSIARHFDKISREAERDRQKRISMARGKRAGRVGVTKAKVQVFNNVRDAFKDEFDSDSSAADNEEDEVSDVSIDSTGRAKPKRKSTPTKPRPVVFPHTRAKPLKDLKGKGRAKTEPGPIVPIEHPGIQRSESSPMDALEQLGTTPTAEPSTLDSTGSTTLVDSTADLQDSRSKSPEETPTEGTKSGAETPALSDVEGLLKDRLHIELAPFDTNAPLANPSQPPTPAPYSEKDADERVPFSQMSQVSESEMSSGGGERSSILKSLTGLWAYRAGDFTPLEYPMSAAEHIFADSRVIVRESEPTSIIAFTLSSKQYRDQMRAVSNTHKAAVRRHEHSSLIDEMTGGERPWDIISVDEAMEQTEDSRGEAGTHLKYDFEAGSSTISCRIFFAEQFAQLRQTCECEDIFVESLARCAKFDASGGKSGSAFLKTKDDRFIVKEISRFEMDAITKFAPAYFEYMFTAFKRGRPTALAKTYGIFKIGYRNAVTGRTMHMNVLVQENLFYSRTFSRIYDLKGSTRNRLVKPTGKPNEVLLDENLLEVSYTNPLYMRDHSKGILQAALWNDTLFLSNLNVMDYSLVVGIDQERKELVIGIVDYIRTFTWDKKVESWVKDFGGGGKGEPTIVTPLQYRKRFRTAMDHIYFPAVPDRWSDVQDEAQPGEEEVQ